MSWVTSNVIIAVIIVVIVVANEVLKFLLLSTDTGTNVIFDMPTRFSTMTSHIFLKVF